MEVDSRFEEGRRDGEVVSSVSSPSSLVLRLCGVGMSDQCILKRKRRREEKWGKKNERRETGKKGENRTKSDTVLPFFLELRVSRFENPSPKNSLEIKIRKAQSRLIYFEFNKKIIIWIRILKHFKKYMYIHF